MGNCQAAEAAAVVIQHPGGRVQRLCWTISAAEVMRANPGHYVALVTLRVAEERQDAEGGARRTVRLTRVKLLKPKENLLLGHAYRLITTHEVTKAVQAKKEEKQRKAQQLLLELRQKQSSARAAATATPAEAEDNNNNNDDDEEALDASLDQLARQDRDGNNRSSSARHRQWRPSLQSIDEAGS
ncbi:hypothetical protein GUJ93_ZPchr0006g41669 [Zizania palustris]|uniref:DUF4228 domain-containing protein n=1 Tax=Zizania palustris TaxID=103762 RepID=A0A8J5W370_ZIZPA|nr:hypothetical protein GUJ93_ZPchr0006g41669 [Zizania palustris]